jgi:hypothetical protein
MSNASAQFEAGEHVNREMYPLPYETVVQSVLFQYANPTLPILNGQIHDNLQSFSAFCISSYAMGVIYGLTQHRVLPFVPQLPTITPRMTAYISMALGIGLAVIDSVYPSTLSGQEGIIAAAVLAGIVSGSVISARNSSTVRLPVAGVVSGITEGTEDALHN